MKAGTRQSEFSQESIEDAIGRVKGVLACQVVLDADGEVQEVHALGTAQRSAKQVVRDIETLFRVRFGRPIDYRKISLVQLDEAAAKHRLARVELKSVSARSGGDRQTVNIELDRAGHRLVGSASGGHTIQQRLRLSAQATLDALAVLIAGDHIVRLADVQLFPLHGNEAVATAVTVVSPEGEETLMGASFVRSQRDLVDELLEAGARATLSAINRRLPMIASR